MSKDHGKQSSSSSSSSSLSAAAGRKKSDHSALKHLIVGNRRKTKHSRQQHKKESKGISATTNLMPTNHDDNIQDSLVKSTHDTADGVLAASTATHDSQDKGNSSMSNHSNEKKRRVHKAKSSTAAAEAKGKTEKTEKAQRRVSHCDETPAKNGLCHEKNVTATTVGDECGGTCSQAVRSHQEIERLRDCMDQLRQDFQSEQDTKTALHQQIAALRKQVEMEEHSKTNRVQAKLKDMDTIHQQNVENNQLRETIHQLKKQHQNDQEALRLQAQDMEGLRKQVKGDEETIYELYDKIEQLHKQQKNDKETIQSLEKEIDLRKKEGQKDRKRWQASIQSINQLEANCVELEARRNEFVHYITQISSLTNNLDATRERQDFRPLPSVASTSLDQWKLFHEPSVLFQDDSDTVVHRPVGSVASAGSSTTQRNNAGNKSNINHESSSAAHLNQNDDNDSDDDYVDPQNISLAPTQTELLKHDQSVEDVDMMQQDNLPTSTPRSDASGPNKTVPKAATSDEKSALATPAVEEEGVMASTESQPTTTKTDTTLVTTTPDPISSQSMETDNLPEAVSAKNDSKPGAPHDSVEANALEDDKEKLSPSKFTQVLDPTYADVMQCDGGDDDETQFPSEFPRGATGRKSSTTPGELLEETLSNTAEISHEHKERDSSTPEATSAKVYSTNTSTMDADQAKPVEACEHQAMEMNEAATQRDRCEDASRKKESTVCDNKSEPKESGKAALSPTANASARSKDLSPSDEPKRATALSADDDSVLWDDDEAGSKSSKTSHQTTLSNWQKPTAGKPKESTEAGWMTTRKPAVPTKKQTSLASFVTPKEKSRSSGRSKKKQQNGSTSFSSSFTKSVAKKRKKTNSPVNLKSDPQEQKRSRLSVSTSFVENITDSEDLINVRPNRVSLSASKAPVPSRLLDTPNHKDLELDSKSYENDDGEVSSDSRGNAERILEPSLGQLEDPVKTTSNQEASKTKTVYSTAVIDKDDDDESQASEMQFNSPPDLGADVAATQSPKHLEIKEVLVRHDSLPTETQLTSHENFGGRLNSPAAKHSTRVSDMNLSQGSETQWDNSSPIIDNKHAPTNTATPKQHKEKEIQISEGSETQCKKLDSTTDAGPSGKTAAPTKALETQLSEGSETQWEKPQSAVIEPGLNGGIMQKNDLPLSQGSETQWEKPETFVEQNDTVERFSLPKGQPAHREAQSQVRFVLPNDTDDSNFCDSSKARATRSGGTINTSPYMNADTQGSETQYEGSALLDTCAIENPKDASAAAAESEGVKSVDKAKKGEGESAKKTKTINAVYSGSWISNQHARNFVDEMDNGRRRSTGKENIHDADFMEQAPQNWKPTYARPSYVEPKRRKTNCNDCRSCAKCRDYYRVLERQGIDTEDPAFQQQNAVKNSRHTIYTPGISSQETPPQFWELSFIDSQEKRAEEALKMAEEEEDNDNTEMAEFEAESFIDSQQKREKEAPKTNEEEEEDNDNSEMVEFEAEEVAASLALLEGSQNDNTRMMETETQI